MTIETSVVANMSQIHKKLGLRTMNQQHVDKFKRIGRKIEPYHKDEGILKTYTNKTSN